MRTRVAGLVAGLVLAVLLAVSAGCSGDSQGSDRAEGSASPTVASSTPTTPPVFVENQTCRTDMGPLVDIMLANDVSSLVYGSFDNRIDQLTKSIDAAVAPCSKRVTGPARRAMYRFTLARAWWDTCGQHDQECTTKVGDGIRAGLKLARTVDYQLDLTT